MNLLRTISTLLLSCFWFAYSQTLNKPEMQPSIQSHDNLWALKADPFSYRSSKLSSNYLKSRSLHRRVLSSTEVTTEINKLKDLTTECDHRIAELKKLQVSAKGVYFGKGATAHHLFEQAIDDFFHLWSPGKIESAQSTLEDKGKKTSIKIGRELRGNHRVKEALQYTFAYTRCASSVKKLVETIHELSELRTRMQASRGNGKGEGEERGAEGGSGEGQAEGSGNEMNDVQQQIVGHKGRRGGRQKRKGGKKR